MWKNFIIFAELFTKNKIRMTTKNTNDLPVIKRSLGGLKKLLAEDLKSERHKIRFKRYGSKYVITNSNSDLTSKLERSFNSFMGKLSVHSDGKKLRGICFIDKLILVEKIKYI